MKILFGKAALALALCAAMPAAQAAGDDDWHGRVEMPFWLYASTGEAQVGNTEVDVDTSFSDAIDSLSSVTGAFAGTAEVRKGRFGAYVGGLYMELTDEAQAGPLEVRTDTDITMWDIGLVWRVKGESDGNSDYLDVVGGMRTFDLEVKLENAATDAEIADAGSSRSHGFIGLKGGNALSDKWMFEYRGDVGGFSSENMTWQAYLGARRSWANNVYLSMGYRLLSIDYTGDNHRYDALQHGPSFALGWKF